MTQKKQKDARKIDKESIVNIQKSGYNEEQMETSEEAFYKDLKGWTSPTTFFS